MYQIEVEEGCGCVEAAERWLRQLEVELPVDVLKSTWPQTSLFQLLSERGCRVGPHPCEDLDLKG